MIRYYIQIPLDSLRNSRPSSLQLGPGARFSKDPVT